MRDECVKVQEQIVAVGAKQAASTMAIRRHTKECPLCREFIQSLVQLEQTENDLDNFEAPQDMVGGTLAKVLGEARERARLQNAGKERPLSERASQFLRSCWRKLFPGDP